MAEVSALSFGDVEARLRADPRFSAIDSQAAGDVLDALRAVFARTADPHERRTAFNMRIGATVESPVRAALVDAREAFERQAIDALIAAIEQAFVRSEDEGWAAWLRAIGDAVVRFRYTYTARLCAHPFAFAPSKAPIVADLTRAAECMQQSRWEEAEEAVTFLSTEEAVSAPARARLIMMRGQIELWRFLEKKRGQALLLEAERLAPTDVMVLGVLGDWSLQEGTRAQAVAYYRRAIEIAPNESNGYVGMGELVEKDAPAAVAAADTPVATDPAPVSAEEWFRRAIAMAPADSTGFDRLIRLLVRTGAFRTNPSEVLSLLERRLAVDPEGEFDAYLALGDHCRDYCRENSVTDAVRVWYRAQSRSWYERARALQPTWPLGCPGLAELCKDEDDFDQAEREGGRTISLAPECPSGYLFLGAFYEARNRRDEAIRVYERFPAKPDRWKLYADATVGRLRAEAGDYDGGLAILLEVLQQEDKTDREQVFAEAALETLADNAYRTRDDDRTARRIFDAILATRGERYRARYHHLLGNLFYYRSDFTSAAAHYRQAIAVTPTDAAYHRYLAGALRGMAQFADAEAEIERAFTLDGDVRKRIEELATLANLQGNRAFEGGAYDDARTFYRKAIELEPATAVYQSNMALACERLQVPGQRIAHLEEAVSWYARAQLAAGDQRHEERIQRLRRRVDLARDYGEQALEWSANPIPLAVEVAKDLVPFVSDPTRTRLSPELEREVEVMRKSIAADLGMTVPGIRFRETERVMPSGSYVIFLDDVPTVSGVSLPTRRFCAGSAEERERWGVEGESATDPLTGAAGSWVTSDHWEAVIAAGADVWTVTGYLMRHLEAIVRRNVVEFLGHQEVFNLLASVPAAQRDAIRTQSSTLSALTNVCRALVAEGVPLQPFDVVCRTFKTLSDEGLRPRDIVERIRLLPEIREHLPGRNGRAYQKTGEAFDAEIRRSLYRKNDRVVLAMMADPCREVLQALRDRLIERDPRGLALVVADQSVRPFVRKLVESEFPDLPVIAAAEERDGAETLYGRVDLPANSPQTTGGFKTPVTAGIPVETAPDDDESGLPGTVEITLSPSLVNQIAPGDDQDLVRLLSLMRDGLFYELGMFAPPVQLHESEGTADESFEVRIAGGVPIRVEGLQRGEALINESPERLRLLRLEGRAAPNPVTGAESTIVRVSPKELAVCRDAGLTVWGPAGYLVLQVSALLRRDAVRLQSTAATRHLIDSLAMTFPDLVQPALERFPLWTIKRILRMLLAEEISIRNLRVIFECLLSLDGSTDVDPDRIVFTANAEPVCFDPQARQTADLPASVLADHVRTWLKRYISNKFTDGSRTLSVYQLANDIEQRIRKTTDQPLTPVEWNRFLEAMREGLKQQAAYVKPVLLVNLDVRSMVRRLLREEFPGLPVLCYQELAPDLNIAPVGRISWR